MTFGKDVNVSEWYCKCEISYTFTLMALFPKSKVVIGLISHSDIGPVGFV